MKSAAAVLAARLPVRHSASARRELPILSRAAPTMRARPSSATARCGERGSPRGASRAATRIIPAGTIRFPEASRSAKFTLDWFMDTQRLILFVIFSFSALFLWERWQASIGRRCRHGSSRPLPATGADAPVPGRPRHRPCRRRPGGRRRDPGRAEREDRGQDRSLYGRRRYARRSVSSEVALTAHRDTHDEHKPYVLLQRNAERDLRRADRVCWATACRITGRSWQALPGPRELTAGRERAGARRCRRPPPTATRSCRR